MGTTLPTGLSPMKPRLIHSLNSKEGIPAQAKKISMGYRSSLDPADDAENLISKTFSNRLDQQQMPSIITVLTQTRHF